MYKTTCIKMLAFHGCSYPLQIYKNVQSLFLLVLFKVEHTQKNYCQFQKEINCYRTRCLNHIGKNAQKCVLFIFFLSTAIE